MEILRGCKRKRGFELFFSCHDKNESKLYFTFVYACWSHSESKCTLLFFFFLKNVREKILYIVINYQCSRGFSGKPLNPFIKALQLYDSCDFSIQTHYDYRFAVAFIWAPICKFLVKSEKYELNFHWRIAHQCAMPLIKWTTLYCLHREINSLSDVSLIKVRCLPRNTLSV